jgi:hypothetical protein
MSIINLFDWDTCPQLSKSGGGGATLKHSDFLDFLSGLKRSRATDSLPPAWGLGGELRPRTVKPLICYETETRASDQGGIFCTTQAQKNGYEISHLQ